MRTSTRKGKENEHGRDIAKGKLEFRVVLENLSDKILGSRPNEVRESESCVNLTRSAPGYSKALRLTCAWVLGG